MTEKVFKRKLSAIFSADAVGYSRLMAGDEAATVKDYSYPPRSYDLSNQTAQGADS